MREGTKPDKAGIVAFEGSEGYSLEQPAIETDNECFKQELDCIVDWLQGVVSNGGCCRRDEGARSSIHPPRRSQISRSLSTPRTSDHNWAQHYMLKDSFAILL